jgi:hypothetical protein
MTKYNDVGEGALFHEKQEGNRPNYTGKITINGTEYRLAGWKRKSSRDNSPFLSLKVTEVVEDFAPQEAVQSEPQADFSQDDVPF